MAHTNNRFLPSPTDRRERQPKMDPRAWLLQVLIARMELQQKDPTVFIWALPPNDLDFRVWRSFRSYLFIGSSRSNNVSDRLALDGEAAAFDAWALLRVMLKVDKNDNLREVFARALRSIGEALLQAGASYEKIHYCSIFRVLRHDLYAKLASKPGSKQEYADASQSDSEFAVAYTLHAFLMSVLHLLTSVFQYLTGYVDRGGSKTYSSGAFDFRASFVALVLFQGAYVWIKFREAARPDCHKRKAPEVVDIEGCNLKGLHKRSIKNASGNFVRFKYEPRFKPPKQEGSSTPIPLGEYHTPAEAQIVRQIARYYYDKDGGCVELKYGPCKFPIPPMSEQERGFAGEAKRKCVQCRGKEAGKKMYVDFQTEEERLAMATEAGSQGAESNDPPSSARPLPCSSVPVFTAVVAGPTIGSACPPSSLPPCDGAIVDFAEDPSFTEDMFDAFFRDPASPNPRNQQSSGVSYQTLYQDFAQLSGAPSFLDVGAVAGVIEHDMEPELKLGPNLQQERVLADASTENAEPQPVVLCQKCLGDNARQFVHLDQLKASHIRNSKLQQENESLKSKWKKLATSQAATWNRILMDIQQEELNDFGFLERSH